MIFSPNRHYNYLGEDEALLNARQCTTVDDKTSFDSTAAIAAGGVGYFTGGKVLVGDLHLFSVVTTKINLFNGATSLVPSADITLARRHLTGYGNADKGFFSGGADAATGVLAAQNISSSWSTVTDRLTYSTDVTAAVVGADLATAKGGAAAVGDSTKGFIAGGRVSLSTYVATADRNTYSTEVTAAVAGADLSQTRAFLAAAGNTTDGYFLSGGRPSQVKTADKLTYSTETTAAAATADIANVIGTPDKGAGGNLETGYFMGGIGFVYTDVLTYATDTTAIGSVNPFTLTSGGAAGNLLGCYLGSSPMMRMDYSTGVAYAATASELPVGSKHIGSVGTGIFT